MYGYIRTHRPELKVWEDEAYKGIYCSLCRELGKKYGLPARMFLSFDTTFFAVALMSLSPCPIQFEKKRCPFNPSKKCNMCKNRQEEISYAADISVLLLYYKIKDNIKDSTFFKALLYKFALLLILFYYKKAKKYSPEADKIIESYILKQNEIENARSSSVDEAAEPTAKMMSQLFSQGEKDEDRKIIRRQLGYNIGRWIYMIDAFDDIEKDRKSGNYNPFIQSGNTDCEKIKGDILMTAGEAAKAFDLLDVKKFGGIVKNVIYDGLYYQTLKIYERRSNNEQSL